MMNISKTHKAISIVFIVNGALFGAWASRVPSIKDSLLLSHQNLSLLLLLLALGAICSFPIAGKLADKMGASQLSAIIYLLYPISFLMLGVSFNLSMFVGCVFLFGFLHGAMDVAMNSWAAQVEHQQKRVLMPFFHGMFSLGAGIGAASGVLMSWFDMLPVGHFSILAMLIYPLYWWVKKSHSDDVPQTNTPPEKTFVSFPKRKVFVIALVAFCCALGEGAMADWTAVYMVEAMFSSHTVAALAYALFSFFMVVMRLFGSQLIKRFGSISLVRVCAASSLLGAIILVLSSSVIMGLLGFSLMGVGYSIIMPLAFSKAASQGEGNSGSVIAGIATFAYGGMLLGPVLIGVLAGGFSLRISFILLIILSLYVFFCAGRLDNDVDRSDSALMESKV